MSNESDLGKYLRNKLLICNTTSLLKTIFPGNCICKIFNLHRRQGKNSSTLIYTFMGQNRRQLDSEVVIFKNYFLNWQRIGLREDILLLEARVLKVLLGSWLLPSGSTAFLKDFLWQNRINKTFHYKFLEWKRESSWAVGMPFNLLFLVQLFQISSLYVSAAVWHAALVHIL